MATLIQYKDLVGSKIKIISVRVASGFIGSIDADEILTIKDVYFNILNEGKIQPVCTTLEYPGTLISLSTVGVESIDLSPTVRAICGEVICGKVICGYDVSSELKTEESDMSGIALIDESGNVITNRYVRIKGASVEDLETDTDEVTDIVINYKGKILD